MGARQKTLQSLPTSIRLSESILAGLKETSTTTNQNEATLIRAAITRCLTDGRWSASPNATGASIRENQLYEAFVDLCAVVGDMSFAVEQALNMTNRKKRIEAKNIAHDALVRLKDAREKLGVC